MSQKFHVGDLVRIADDLGPRMRHFTKGVDGIVVGSYADQFSSQQGRDERQFTVFIQGSGPHSWYDVSHLTLIEAGRVDLLTAWREAIRRPAPAWGNA